MTHIDSLDPGMMLAEDVRDRSGRLLLGAGDVLLDKHIKIFRTWGVTEVSVVGNYPDGIAPQVSNDIDPNVLTEMEENLKPRVLHTDLDHPVMKELLRLSALQRIRHGIS